METQMNNFRAITRINQITRKLRRGAPVLCAALLLTLALSASARAQNVTVQYITVQDWGTGFQGQVTINNLGDGVTKGITNWTLEFDLGVSITSIFDATILSHTG